MANQNFQKKPLLLLLSGCSLFALSFFTAFSSIIFIAFVPIFLLLDIPWDTKKVHALFLISVACILCLTFIPGPWKIAGVFYYGVSVIVLFTSYFVAQQFTQNRLNKFSLIIVWLGLEYLFLAFLSHKNPFLLADVFQNHSPWVRWNIYTGYTGASLWILLINLQVFQAVKGPKVNYFFLFLAAMLTILPIIYSISLSQNALTKEDVIAFYSSNRAANGYSGELISRTGAWVSVLIIIFTLIRVKIKKVAR